VCPTTRAQHAAASHRAAGSGILSTFASRRCTTCAACALHPTDCLALPSFFCLQLKDLKVELGGLRVAKVTGGAPNKLSKM
jgi:hypothetical protein